MLVENRIKEGTSLIYQNFLCKFSKWFGQDYLLKRDKKIQSSYKEKSRLDTFPRLFIFSDLKIHLNKAFLNKIIEFRDKFRQMMSIKAQEISGHCNEENSIKTMCLK
ncbi:unnamed protein product [Moneuplotes crassus]|uniref:Uncharacterized protein n=1 Tax=Euplotes crassus TaxID=5936 RepID=A0AAD1U6B0_EUPCR|nr:unnamed protein product [Moneuplotes crassus]